MKLSQARVLLVGASGGIGQAMTRQLRAAGAHVVCVGRRWPQGMDKDALAADITQPSGRALICQAVKDQQINVVVIASGLALFGPCQEANEMALEQLIQTNVTAPIQLVTGLLAELHRCQHAQLIFVGSALGRIGVPGFSAYGASKAAIHGFAEGLRRELSGTSVRVQLLAPRATQTSFNDSKTEEFNRLTGTQSDSPDLVANALLSLIESEAAERFMGFPERLGVRLNGLLGAWMDGSFKSHVRALATVFSKKQ
jgi:short-subunit dehydrogenase